MKSLRKKWIFRIAALTLIPLLLLGVLELALRLVGFGYPASFYLETTRGGETRVTANEKFTWLFFPPPLSRGPLPMAVFDPKPRGTYRIFIMGGSAARGSPEPAFAFGRILKILLEDRFAGREFEVINLGITAVNSHVVLQIARETAALDGDLWILYMGNNEVMGPYGAGSIFGARAPGRSFVRASVAAKSTRTGQLLDRALSHLIGKDVPFQFWQGWQMFLEQKIRHDDQALKRVYDNFHHNLKDIVDIAVEADAKIIVNTLVSNLKDCAPFASLHSRTLAKEEKENWEEFYRQGSRYASEGNCPKALEFYRRALALDAEHAELHFRVGRCCWSMGEYENAKRHFIQARELDAIRFRPATRINDIVREISSSRHKEGVRLVDAEQIFAMNSPHGVTGGEFLYEHVHFSFSGNYLLARSLADKIRMILHESHVDANESEWLGGADCARKLAFTPWDRYRVTNMVLNSLQQSLYKNQLNNADQQLRLQKQLSQLNQLVRTVGFERQDETYQEALSQSADDWVLREQYATFLTSFAKNDEAKRQLLKVLEMAPNHIPARYNLGMIYYFFEDYPEAEECYRKVSQSKPYFYGARRNLGLALAKQGKHEAACVQFAKAVDLTVDSAEVYVRWGESLEALNRMEEAREQYQKSLEIQADHTEALQRLAELEAKEDSANKR
jgi:tetratricopeptide (TPR) repeat protein